jgi:chitinase
MASLCFLVQLCFFAQNNNLSVTAYSAGNLLQLDSFNSKKLTHIIFSFCHLKGNRLSVDNGKDTLRIKKLVALKKKNPALKVLLSLGGWGGCETCSDVFATDTGRKTFASSVREVNDFFGTDGIDLDWEYPAIEGFPGHRFQTQDKQNFTALIGDLRDSLGTRNEISFAAGGFQKFIDEAVEWEKIMPLLDRVNLMSYDLVNGYSAITGHHTPLYTTLQQKESADNAITALLQKGVPASKIVIGAAFYGRVWENVPPTNNGLYQAGKFKTSVGFKNFENSYSKKQGFTRYWDEAARAPYLYNSAKEIFVTYDDTQSLTEKTGYALEKGLNGIMFWELSHDLPNGGLLDAIDKAKKVNQQQVPTKKRKAS